MNINLEKFHLPVSDMENAKKQTPDGSTVHTAKQNIDLVMKTLEKLSFHP